jgi:hypothetical protein
MLPQLIIGSIIRLPLFCRKIMAPTFVLFQVGNSIEPILLVKSIRKLMPDACVLQCSDKGTEQIEGVDRRIVVEGDLSCLMTLRLKAYSELALEEPAAYLDSDMILLRPLDPAVVLGDADVAVCERSFGRDGLFNVNFKGLDLGAYRNKTLGEVYPYLACFTVTKDCRFWAKANELLLTMNSTFHRWFGDQEAIRELVKSGVFKVTKVPESAYGCLPDMISKTSTPPRLLHFKGSTRKQAMLDYSSAIGLIGNDG